MNTKDLDNFATLLKRCTDNDLHELETLIRNEYAKRGDTKKMDMYDCMNRYYNTSVYAANNEDGVYSDNNDDGVCINNC